MSWAVMSSAMPGVFPSTSSTRTLPSTSPSWRPDDEVVGEYDLALRIDRAADQYLRRQGRPRCIFRSEGRAADQFVAIDGSLGFGLRGFRAYRSGEVEHRSASGRAHRVTSKTHVRALRQQPRQVRESPARTPRDRIEVEVQAGADGEKCRPGAAAFAALQLYLDLADAIRAAVRRVSLGFDRPS